LLANAVTLRREKSILFNRVAILILLYSGILAYDSLAIGSLDTGIGVFSGLFHSTAITHSFDIFIYIIGAVILQLTSFYPRRLRTAKLTSSSPPSHSSRREEVKRGDRGGEKSKLVNKNEEQFLIIEYPLVILFILIGATFLMSSSDLVSMFIAIELQSYGLYILATLYRNSELSTTAGLTYFLLGGLSSCFILLGSSLLYLNSGLTNLDGIYVLASLCDENKGVEAVTFIIDNGFIKTMNVNSQSFNLALLILIIGYLFKVSSAPFHF
jgi:NADH-ubiquinone oxidoreductase chain 2